MKSYGLQKSTNYDSTGDQHVFGLSSNWAPLCKFPSTMTRTCCPGLFHLPLRKKDKQQNNDFIDAAPSVAARTSLSMIAPVPAPTLTS